MNDATEERTWGTPDCRVYWGSHGCHLQRGHEGHCECDCCDCPEGTHPNPDPNVLCVAKFPYYGPETRFYGEDVASRGLPDRDVPIERHCGQCGVHWQEPLDNANEPDPCLGLLPGVWSACCGHGEGNGYIAFTNGPTIRFDRLVVERYEIPAFVYPENKEPT